MFHVLLCSTFLRGILSQDPIGDLNCTYVSEGQPKFSHKATNCANRFDENYCISLFGDPVEVDSAEDRSELCYKNGFLETSEDVKHLASETCPATCGYCCITRAFSCSNAKSPRVSCDIVTPLMCVDPFWKPILIEDCPNICGFCELGCFDRAHFCARDVSICWHPDMIEFAKENCRRTCNYCTFTGDCGPDHPYCVHWVRNNFCINPFYTTQQKRTYCPRSCKLC
ncbi:unnamed protein product [Cylicocyclus nassatus]|uniref:ShKT domain-containing protein n=1 Tax=Cylicocyclus nassatus TaxID=53992 RepID=A0AA36H3I1_CYLNA|nr:unnamed protein product [Cylicocyclus nassatus]